MPVRARFCLFLLCIAYTATGALPCLFGIMLAGGWKWVANAKANVGTRVEAFRWKGASPCDKKQRKRSRCKVFVECFMRKSSKFDEFVKGVSKEGDSPFIRGDAFLSNEIFLVAKVSATK